MSDNTNEYQVLLDVVRQNYASVVWTHKIQIKQADIYASRYSCLETANILLAAVASCGAVSIFADQDSFILKIVTVIFSFATTALAAYQRSFDLKTMEKQHKDAAEHFLVIRNDLLHLIAEIHMQKEAVNELDKRFHEIEEKYNSLYLSAPSTTSAAVKAAAEALGENKEYTYTSDEIDWFLPPALRGFVKKKGGILMALAAKVDGFDTFCSSIVLDNYEEMEKSAKSIAKKLNSVYYDLDKDDTSHLYIVGSVGRKTAIKGNSDLDILFDLPSDTYKKFDAYQSNGQSALLQEVKESLQERYPKTDISGDGQVVVIEFNHYTVELVPGFKQSDGRFKYPDTHNGGSWKYTDPLPEQDACQACDETSNGIYFDFCHIIRKWKNGQGFKFGGLLIDTLVHDHFEDNEFYKTASIDDYFDILKSLFSYLGEQDKDRTYWYAVGSNQQVMNSGNGAFVDKAKDALKKIDAAEQNDSISDVLQEIFGNEYPVEQRILEQAAFATCSFDNTEQFIQNLFPIDIRYSLSLDCEVRQNGFRERLLSAILRDRQLLRHNKQLEFFVVKTDCPKPYDIYWKVKNVGSVAERRNCIRGQIEKTNSQIHREHTDFQGSHYVECYLVKNNVCVARAHINVPIGVA